MMSQALTADALDEAASRAGDTQGAPVFGRRNVIVAVALFLVGLGSLMGLQRAFQVAGARTVVASLWSVPDEPTKVLMERFYANRWEKKMSKLNALREAQLWMLREGRGDALVQRGIRRVGPAPPPAGDGRLPPYYWAAFVLSGDWR